MSEPAPLKIESSLAPWLTGTGDTPLADYEASLPTPTTPYERQLLQPVTPPPTSALPVNQQIALKMREADADLTSLTHDDKGEVIRTLMARGVLTDDDFGEATTILDKQGASAGADYLIRLGTRRVMETNAVNASPLLKKAAISLTNNILTSLGGDITQIASLASNANFLHMPEAQLARDITFALQGMGAAPIGTSTYETGQAAIRKLITDMNASYFGAPDPDTDPVSYELWQREYGAIPMLLGDISAFALEFALFKRLPIISAIGKGPLGARYLRGIVPSLVVPGAGFGASYLGAKYGFDPEHPLSWGFAGAGIATLAFGTGIIPGRITGLTERGMLRADIISKFGKAGMDKMFARFPNLTVGRMAESAAIGAFYDTSMAVGEGKPPAEAILEGVKGAGTWAFYDLALTRMTNAANIFALKTDFETNIAARLGALKFFKDDAMAAHTAAQILQGALVASVPTGIGYMAGGVPGAIGGFAVGAGLRGWQHSLTKKIPVARAMLVLELGDELAGKLARGEWSKLTPEECGKIASTIFSQAAEDTASNLDDVLGTLLFRSSGMKVKEFGNDLEKWTAAKRAITQRIEEFERVGVPTTDARYAKLNTALAQIEAKRQQLILADHAVQIAEAEREGVPRSMVPPQQPAPRVNPFGEMLDEMGADNTGITPPMRNRQLLDDVQLAQSTGVVVNNPTMEVTPGSLASESWENDGLFALVGSEILDEGVGSTVKRAAYATPRILAPTLTTLRAELAAAKAAIIDAEARGLQPNDVAPLIRRAQTLQGQISRIESAQTAAREFFQPKSAQESAEILSKVEGDTATLVAEQPAIAKKLEAPVEPVPPPTRGTGRYAAANQVAPAGAGKVKRPLDIGDEAPTVEATPLGKLRGRLESIEDSIRIDTILLRTNRERLTQNLSGETPELVNRRIAQHVSRLEGLQRERDVVRSKIAELEGGTATVSNRVAEITARMAEIEQTLLRLRKTIGPESKKYNRRAWSVESDKLTREHQALFSERRALEGGVEAPAIVPTPGPAAAVAPTTKVEPPPLAPLTDDELKAWLNSYHSRDAIETAREHMRKLSMEDLTKLVRSELGGKIAGAGLVGIALADSVIDWRNPDALTDPNAPPVNKAGLDVISAAVMLALGLGLFKGRARFRTPGGKVSPIEAAMEILRPAIGDPIERSVAERLVGVPTKHLKATVKMADGTTKTVTGRAAFLRMPVDLQIEHFLRRMLAIANLDHAATPAEKGSRARTAAENRINHFIRTSVSYFPTAMTRGDFNRVEDAFMTHAKTIGMTELERNEAWRALLTISLEDPATRLSQMASKNVLADLAASGTGPFGSIADIANLGDAYEAVKLISGGVWDGAPRRLVKKFRKGLHDQAKAVKEITAEIDGAARDVRLVGGKGESPIIPFGGQVMPLMTMLRHGQELKAKGVRLNQPGLENLGQDIFDGAMGILRQTTKIREGIQNEWQPLRDSLMRLTDADMPMLRQALTDKTFRDSLVGVRDDILAVTNAWIPIREGWRKKFNLPDFLTIEEYLPWYYSKRTIPELRTLLGKGEIPTDFEAPAEYGLAQYKFFRSLLPRGNAPIGELMDPRETMYLYIVGANRKFYLDDLINKMGVDYWKRIRSQQPALASVLGQHYLDALGVPTTAYLKFIGQMDKFGRFLTALNDFVPTDALKDLADEYFLNGAGTKIPHIIRGWEFFTKIGGSAISAMVNLSQLPINGGSLLYTSSLFKNVIQTVQGATADRFPLVAPLIDPGAKGLAKWRLVKKAGILSEVATRAADELAAMRGVTKQGMVRRTIGAAALGGATGAVAGATLNQITGDEGYATKLAYAGIVGAAGIQLASRALAKQGMITAASDEAVARVFKHGILKVRNMLITPFEAVETINRSATYGSALELGGKVAKMSPKDLAAQGTRGAVKGAILGAGGGAALGYIASAEPENRPFNMTAGAALGGAMGLWGGGVSETREARAAKALGIIRSRRFRFMEELPADWEKAVKREFRPITEEEVLNEFARLYTDMTQFRMGREARGPLLRTPYGEILGALQSFTLNQAEFVGGMWTGFAKSLQEYRLGRRSDIDLRFFRHLALLFGVSSAYGMAAGWSGSDKSPQYWAGRFGFGLAPFLQWNENSERWQFVNLMQSVGGPFVSDAVRAANFALGVMFSAKRARALNRDADTLAMQLVPALRQARNAGPWFEGIVDKAQIEGLSDLAATLSPILRTVAQPGTTLRMRQLNEAPTNPSGAWPTD